MTGIAGLQESRLNQAQFKHLDSKGQTQTPNNTSFIFQSDKPVHLNFKPLYLEITKLVKNYAYKSIDYKI